MAGMKAPNLLHNPDLPKAIPTLPDGTLDANAILSSLQDKRREGLYDRVRLKAGTATPATIRAFCQPVGRDRNWTDTNLTQHGMLPAPQHMIVEGLLLLFQPNASMRDIAAVASSYVFDFRILQKSFWRGPFQLFAARGPIAEVIPTVGEPENIGTCSRVGSLLSFQLGDYSKYLPPFVNFGVDLVGEPVTLESDLEFYVILDGAHGVAVQW